MPNNYREDELVRGPDYCRTDASFIIEEIARRDVLRNPSLCEKLNGVAKRIEKSTYDLPDIRLLEMFRRSSTTLKKDDLFYKLLKRVIWQMRHRLWLDD